jgi:hypothetical protein
VPVTILGQPESAGARRHPNDMRINLENIRLDRHEVLRNLLALIEVRRRERVTAL